MISTYERSPVPCLVISAKSEYYKGRARYRPIDDRARYWENFLGGEDELRKFSEEKKKKRIMSRLKPMLIPLTVQCNYH